MNGSLIEDAVKKAQRMLALAAGELYQNRLLDREPESIVLEAELEKIINRLDEFTVDLNEKLGK